MACFFLKAGSPGFPLTRIFFFQARVHRAEVHTKLGRLDAAHQDYTALVRRMARGGWAALLAVFPLAAV